MRYVILSTIINIKITKISHFQYTSLFDFSRSDFFFSPGGFYQTDSIPGFKTSYTTVTSLSPLSPDSPASPFSPVQTGTRNLYFSPADFEYQHYQLEFFSPAQRVLSPHELYDSSDVTSEFFDNGASLSSASIVLSCFVLFLLF